MLAIGPTLPFALRMSMDFCRQHGICLFEPTRLVVHSTGHRAVEDLRRMESWLNSRLLRRGDHPEPNEAAEHPVSVNGEGWWVVCPTVLSFDAGAFPSAPSGT